MSGGCWPRGPLLLLLVTAAVLAALGTYVAGAARAAGRLPARPAAGQSRLYMGVFRCEGKCRNILFACVAHSLVPPPHFLSLFHFRSLVENR